MQIFENAVKLRGFLGTDAEVPPSEGIAEDAFAVLKLCIDSGYWNTAASEWKSFTVRLKIICPGPYFCGLTRGMKQGDYIEVEGELRLFKYEQPLVVSREPFLAKLSGNEVHASQIRRLEYPPFGVNERR